MEKDNLIDISSCIICMETNYNEIIFECKHSICLNCYEKMLNMHNIVYCPICRNIVENIAKHNIIVEREYPLCRRIFTSFWCWGLIIFILLGGLTFFFIK